MCRWHKVTAKHLATDPQTGAFDVGRFAIALTAMGVNRVEQNKWGLAGLYEIDGFNPEEILEPERLAVYQNAPFYEERDLDTILSDLQAHEEHLRAALDVTAACCDISKEGLGITDNVTADGYKKTCCAPANPRENGPFLDAAVVNLFKGYDKADRSHVSGELELVSFDELINMTDDETVAEHDRPYLRQLTGVLAATEHFMSQDGVKDSLDACFRHSVDFIFATAQSDLDNGLGLSGPSDCIMCEGAKGRKSANPAPTAD
ncbi:MAG: hypothetical protein AB7E85_01440 [Pseudobdellovibrionaceae bacterium]